MIKNGKSLITILDDFEGSMIGKYEIKNNDIFFNLKKENPTYGFRNKKFDYNLHFNFGLYNPSNSKKTINIFINCQNIPKSNLPRLWTSDDFKNEYKLTNNINGKTNFHGQYYFNLSIDKNEKLYIANFPPKSYSYIQKTFQNLSNKSDAKEVIIGKTLEDRTITAYEYGDINEKPTILFVSGFHPPERDTIAIEGIMEKFLNKSWRENIFSNYSFSFIPILNPDGFANKMQGSNINEINFHWKFFGNSKDECPEAYHIWDYCQKIKPIVFFDFHAFTFQDNTARPYLIPEGYYINKKTKHIQTYINNKLIELCKNKYSKNEVILAPNLLATRLRKKIGTVTVPKFHLHMKDGLENCKKMSLKCLEIILDILNKSEITSKCEVLYKPYGDVKFNILDKMKIMILDIWYLNIKYLIKKLHK
jgi:hypothetical protein